MLIAIDVDSTLHHYWDQFAAAAKRRFGVDLPYEHQLTWDVTQLRPEQVRACVEETHRDDNVLAAVPYAGAVEVVRRWHEAGHSILVTSHRAERCSQATERWLHEIGLPFDELHCSYDKVGHCRERAVDLLIDDSPANLADAIAAGIAVGTIAHPWNSDFCELEDVACGDDWLALERALEPLLGAGGRPPGGAAASHSASSA